MTVAELIKQLELYPPNAVLMGGEDYTPVAQVTLSIPGTGNNEVEITVYCERLEDQ